MTTSDDPALLERVAQLEARNEELQRKLKLYAPSTERLPGGKVVIVFFSLISLSMVLAASLWFSGRDAARKRAQRPTPVVASQRVDDAGWAIVRNIHTCLAETTMNDTVDVRLEVRLTPAGTVGLVDTAIKPGNERFVPCVRKAPAGVKVEAQGGTEAPALEVRYLVERPQEGSYQARWSWRQLL
ncbi:MAG: hypothetical protein MUF64_04475 [Polyangiaceae bacterium]|jgi:hypothetical protein|nr:hypothetical protein [Polyangiaceae bacterium]